MKRSLAVIAGFLIALVAASWCKARLELWFNTFEFDDFAHIPGLGLVYPNTLLTVTAYAIPFFAAGLLWSRVPPFSERPVAWSVALGVAFLGACLLAQQLPEPIPTPRAGSVALPLLIIYWSNWWLPPVAAAIGATVGRKRSRPPRPNAA